MSGPNPTSSLELLAWVNINGEPINREELKILRRMDAVYCATVSQEIALANKVQND